MQNFLKLHTLDFSEERKTRSAGDVFYVSIHAIKSVMPWSLYPTFAEIAFDGGGNVRHCFESVAEVMEKIAAAEKRK